MAVQTVQTQIRLLLDDPSLHYLPFHKIFIKTTVFNCVLRSLFFSENVFKTPVHIIYRKTKFRIKLARNLGMKTDYSRQFHSGSVFPCISSSIIFHISDQH